MDTVTYPDPTVVSFLSERFVPVHMHVAEQEQALAPYALPWTPGLVVLDADLRQHRRMIGYHTPRDLVAELSLAWLTEAVTRGAFEEARERARAAAERCKGDPEREAEARYYDVAAEYKLTGDGLKRGWSALVDAFPGTTWARKVEFIRSKR